MYVCTGEVVHTVHKTDPVLSPIERIPAYTTDAKQDTVSTIEYAEEAYSTLTNTLLQFNKRLESFASCYTPAHSTGGF
jgi:hypothetical protein